MRNACSTQSTYSDGVSRPIMSVRLRMSVLRLRQLSAIDADSTTRPGGAQARSARRDRPLPARAGTGRDGGARAPAALPPAHDRRPANGSPPPPDAAARARADRRRGRGRPRARPQPAPTRRVRCAPRCATTPTGSARPGGGQSSSCSSSTAAPILDSARGGLRGGHRPGSQRRAHRARHRDARRLRLHALGRGDPPLRLHAGLPQHARLLHTRAPRDRLRGLRGPGRDARRAQPAARRAGLRHRLPLRLEPQRRQVRRDDGRRHRARGLPPERASSASTCRSSSSRSSRRRARASGRCCSAAASCSSA